MIDIWVGGGVKVTLVYTPIMSKTTHKSRFEALLQAATQPAPKARGTKGSRRSGDSNATRSNQGKTASASKKRSGGSR